ncbi:hypothetical protein ACIGXM_15595 [Kitasatospora sp. NPDC052896]|uniref:hypothetical protein n=1 Tax=Kitasatospora sp. NPDC052896 TaxID=3364061 RepID=UPI0037CC55B1
MKTRILKMLAPLVIAIGSVIGVPAAAHAATLCGGYTNIGEAEQFKDSKGVPMATLYLYSKGGPGSQYSSDTPTCGILFAEGSYSQESKYMGITLCSNYIGVPCTTDHGNYREYAGPVYQARGGCGQATFVMKNPQGTTIVSGTRGFNCD